MVREHCTNCGTASGIARVPLFQREKIQAESPAPRGECLLKLIDAHNMFIYICDLNGGFYIRFLKFIQNNHCFSNMIFIISNIILAIAVFGRTYQGVITNERYLNCIISYCNKVNQYMYDIASSTFPEASKELLKKTMKYLIWAWLIFYMLNILFLGLGREVKGDAIIPFAIEEMKPFAYSLGIILAVSHGLAYDFGGILKFIIFTQKKILKSPASFLLIFIYYVFLTGVGVIIHNTHNIAYSDILSTLADLFREDFWGIAPMLLFPVLIIFFLQLAVTCVNIFIWGVGRLICFVVFLGFKKFFSFCIDAKREDPMKIFLLFVHISIVILWTFKNYFDKLLF